MSGGLSGNAYNLIRNFFFKFMYFERERESVCVCTQGRGRERGRERIPSRLHAVSTEPDVEPELMNHGIMT